MPEVIEIVLVKPKLPHTLGDGPHRFDALLRILLLVQHFGHTGRLPVLWQMSVLFHTKFNGLINYNIRPSDPGAPARSVTELYYISFG